MSEDRLGFVRALAGINSDMPTEWITAAETAAMAGCSRQAVDHYVRKGMIKRRYPLGRKTPSLNRESAEEFARWWPQHVAEVQAKRRPPETRPPSGPPQDGDVWLDCMTASLVVGVSAQYLGRLARAGRLPAVKDARRDKWWFRRRDVEQFAAARALALRFAAHGASGSHTVEAQPAG